MLRQSKFFYLAVCFSMVLHALLIVGVKFKPDITKFLHDKMPPLEVVLVNSQSQAPKEAELLAQANLDHAGEQEKQAQATATLHPIETKKIKPSVTKVEKLSQKLDKVETESREKQAQVKNLENKAKQLLNQIQSKAIVETSPTPTPSTIEPASPTKTLNLNASDIIASSDDISRTEAQIARQQEDYQHRPRRKSVGIRTQEYKFAMYVEAWRQKVERIGNLNYPAAAREQHLYGNLQMTVYIKADGTLEKIEIRRSSGQRVLDDAARRIVELSAPFPPFSEDMRKEVDILDITRTWTFTKQDSFNGGE